MGFRRVNTNVTRGWIARDQIVAEIGAVGLGVDSDKIANFRECSRRYRRLSSRRRIRNDHGIETASMLLDDFLELLSQILGQRPIIGKIDFGYLTEIRPVDGPRFARGFDARPRDTAKLHIWLEMLADQFLVARIGSDAGNISTSRQKLAT